MSDAQWVVRDVIAGENDMVTVRWTGQGTHDGNLAGMIPPTGKQVRVEALTLFRIKGDKIAELWDCWDALGLLQQVGVVPRWGKPKIPTIIHDALQTTRTTLGYLRRIVAWSTSKQVACPQGNASTWYNAPHDNWCYQVYSWM
jgi:hypothetical protein